jgi:hypothetical protein
MQAGNQQLFITVRGIEGVGFASETMLVRPTAFKSEEYRK